MDFRTTDLFWQQKPTDLAMKNKVGHFCSEKRQKFIPKRRGVLHGVKKTKTDKKYYDLAMSKPILEFRQRFSVITKNKTPQLSRKWMVAVTALIRVQQEALHKKKKTTPKSPQLHDMILVTIVRMQYPLRTHVFLLCQVLDGKYNHYCGSLANTFISPGLDNFTHTFMSCRKTYQLCNFLYDSFTQGYLLVQFHWFSLNDIILNMVPSPKTNSKNTKNKVFAN